MQALKSPRRASLLALTVALACAAPPSAASAATNPLPGLFSDPSNRHLCFRRIYDKAHLRRHPGQRTTSMLVSIAPLDNTDGSIWVKMRLYLKGRPSPAPVGATCNWDAKANRDTSGNRLIPRYPREDGFACLAAYNNEAAEEAGTLMLDLAADGRSLMVYLSNEGIGMWGTNPPEHIEPSKDPSVWLKVGTEDRVFRLTGAEPDACRDMDQAIDIK